MNAIGTTIDITFTFIYFILSLKRILKIGAFMATLRMAFWT